MTRGEAETILGASIRSPVLGVQGPTCLYPRSKRSQPFITLSVQSNDALAALRDGRHKIRADIAGHRAYCVDYGGPRIIVPLDANRVLNVSGACPVASRFAAKALARLAR